MTEKKVAVKNFIYATSDNRIVEVQIQVDPTKIELSNDDESTFSAQERIQYNLSNDENPWKALGVPDHVAKAKLGNTIIEDSASTISSTTTNSTDVVQMFSLNPLLAASAASVPSRGTTYPSHSQDTELCLWTNTEVLQQSPGAYSDLKRQRTDNS